MMTSTSRAQQTLISTPNPFSIDRGSSMQRGFTLVELLLTVVLLGLLLGASVFSFSALRQGAELHEGVERLETLLRLARAHAAQSGRLVEVDFEPDARENFAPGPGRIRIRWERDPFGKPGEFEDLIGPAWRVAEELAELIVIESVRPLDQPQGAAEAVLDLEFPQTLPESFKGGRARPAPILFYPDGSSDSVEIIVAARDPEDARRFATRLQGITGLIRRQLVSEDDGLGEFDQHGQARDPDETPARTPALNP